MARARGVDPKTREWFDPATVQVLKPVELNDWLADEELVRLSGAPKDSVLRVSATEDGAIELCVSNPDVLSEDMVRLLVQEDQGYVYYLVNAAFVLNDDRMGQGIGSRSICIELEQARALGYITRVRVDAVGDYKNFDADPPYRGYYVWPRMGFDAPLPASLLTHPELPPGLGEQPRLLDLLDTEQGERFWLEHGFSLWVEFDLKAGSRSWERLARYTSEHDIEVQP